MSSRSTDDQPRSKSVTIPRQAVRWLILILAPFLGVLILFAWLQRSLIYVPTRVDSLRGRCELPGCDVQLTTQDNLTLNGWLALAGPPNEPRLKNLSEVGRRGRLLVMLFPGNGGNRSLRIETLEILTQAGADVVIFDHRGYGDNPGSPTEELLARDARVQWEFVTQTLAVPRERIVIYGESLGGGIATRLAGSLCEAGTAPGGLIIEASFDSLVSAGRFHFPYLPVNLLLVDRFPSVEWIRKVTCPILQFHGDQDEIVPVTLGQTLFAAAPDRSESGIAKRWIGLPQTHHNDVFGPDRMLVVTAIQTFLKEAVAASLPLNE